MCNGAPVTRPKMLPREIALGPVTLDLFHNDVRAGDRWVGLHPREFKLLWRLAETPYQAVTRQQLLRDVWRLRHVPETNSVEVHVSRLRRKLAVFGCDWLVVTDPEGGYRLNPDGPEKSFMIARGTPEQLDSHLRTLQDQDIGES